MKRTLDKNRAGRMVLYHAVSSYQLLEVILHRQTYHREEKAVLLLPDFITEKYPQYQKIENGRWFDEVYLFPYLRIPHQDEKHLFSDVARCFAQRIPYELSDFSAVYVAGAHFYFSLYLIAKHRPFVFFEDAAGMLSRWEILYRGLCNTFPVHAEIARKYGLFNGENPLIYRIVCLKQAQTIDVTGQRFEDFSVEDALENLTFRKRRRLIRLFIPNKIKGRADAVLLTQNFAWLGLMSINEQKQLYENIRDSVLSGMRLFVKVHPDDTLDYSGIFPKARIIERAFPSELLPYVFFHKPPLLYAVNSAGCENLIKHFKIRKLGRDVYAE